MSKITNILGITAILTPFFIWLPAVSVTVYGLVLGFKANIAIGIIYLVLCPLGFITGLLDIFMDINIAELIVNILESLKN